MREEKAGGFCSPKSCLAKPQARTQLQLENPKKLQASEAEAGRSEFQATLVYGVNSRTARATKRNPVSKQNKTKHKQTNKQTKGSMMGGLF